MPPRPQEKLLQPVGVRGACMVQLKPAGASASPCGGRGGLYSENPELVDALEQVLGSNAAAARVLEVLDPMAGRLNRLPLTIPLAVMMLLPILAMMIGAFTIPQNMVFLIPVATLVTIVALVIFASPLHGGRARAAALAETEGELLPRLQSIAPSLTKDGRRVDFRLQRFREGVMPSLVMDVTAPPAGSSDHLPPWAALRPDERLEERRFVVGHRTSLLGKTEIDDTYSVHVQTHGLSKAAFLDCIERTQQLARDHRGPGYLGPVIPPAILMLGMFAMVPLDWDFSSYVMLILGVLSMPAMLAGWGYAVYRGRGLRSALVVLLDEFSAAHPEARFHLPYPRLGSFAGEMMLLMTLPASFALSEPSTGDDTTDTVIYLGRAGAGAGAGRPDVSDAPSEQEALLA